MISATSVVYENICQECNPGAGGEKGLESVEDRFPTAYVGETSRSIMERTGEHWEAFRSRNKESHILKHQEMEHCGAPPKFIVRVVGRAKSALERQVKEAVRIKRRGGEGAILNSKAEFNRSYIPRLRLEEQTIVNQLEEEEKKRDEQVARELAKNQSDWEHGKTQERKEQQQRVARELQTGAGSVGDAKKRIKEQKDIERGSRSRKKMKFARVGAGWGEQNTGLLLNVRREQLLEIGEEETTSSSQSKVAVEQHFSPPRVEQQSSPPAGREREQSTTGEQDLPPEPPPTLLLPPIGGTPSKLEGRGNQALLVDRVVSITDCQESGIVAAGSSFGESPDQVEDVPKEAVEKEEIEEMASTELERRIPPPEDQGVGKVDQTVTPSVSSTEEKAQCIVRKGRCQTHGVEARKVVRKTKKWGKKKDGFGWNYSSKVEYKCMMEKIGTLEPDISTTDLRINVDKPAMNCSKGRNGSHVGESYKNILERGPAEGLTGGTSQD